MSDRGVESLNGPSVKDIAPQKDVVRDLNGIKIEPASNLDGTAGTIYRPKTQQELDQMEAEEYQLPTPFEGVLVSDLLRKVGSVGATVLIAAGAGDAVLPLNEAKAETRMVSPSGMPSQAALAGYGVDTETDQNPTPAVGMSEPTEAPTPSAEDAEYTATIVALESLEYSTEHYAERQRKINEYKEKLRADGCQEINLEAVAEVCYATEQSKGFSDKKFVYQEKTILKNYVTMEQWFEFGRTGEVPEGANFQVIYFKDENGKPTKEPAIFYVANPENKVFDINVVQNSIDWWEERCTGYLETLVSNGFRVILHSQAGKNEKVQKKKYGEGIYYVNYSGKSASSFEADLNTSSLEESFGMRCKALGLTNNEQALIKPVLALLCFQYALVDNSKDEGLIAFIDGNQDQIVLYNDMYGEGRSPEQIKALIEKAKKVIVPPFRAKSWKHISDVIDTANATAKAD